MNGIRYYSILAVGLIVSYGIIYLVLFFFGAHSFKNALMVLTGIYLLNLIISWLGWAKRTFRKR
jgi:hypothetical protein